MKPFIVAIDVGAPRNIGWHCSTFEKEPGDNSCRTIDDLSGLLEKKDYLAIGFEAPLFIPVTDFKNFTKKREVDGNRLWSAGAGAYVTTVNLPFGSSSLNRSRSIRSIIVKRSFRLMRMNCRSLSSAPGRTAKRFPATIF